MKKFSSKQGSKLTKTANGYKFQMSQDEWLRVGNQAGWLKAAGHGSNSWQDADGFVSLEIHRDPDGHPQAWFDSATDLPLDPRISQEVNSAVTNPSDEYFEVSINYKSTGYSDPGVHTLSNGDPGYPPEGDDERIVSSVELLHGTPESITLDPSANQIFQEVYRGRIDTDESVDTSPDANYNGPDRSDEY